jgi:hypothetical protein
MPFENPRTTQGPERILTPEQREREMKSKMFKGLLAVGVGVLWAEWNGLAAIDPLSSGPNEKNSKLIKKKGFWGAAVQKVKNTYGNLETVEKFLDPTGETGLVDLFEKMFPDKTEGQERKEATV